MSDRPQIALAQSLRAMRGIPNRVRGLLAPEAEHPAGRDDRAERSVRHGRPSRRGARPREHAQLSDRFIRDNDRAQYVAARAATLFSQGQRDGIVTSPA